MSQTDRGVSLRAGAIRSHRVPRVENPLVPASGGVNVTGRSSNTAGKGQVCSETARVQGARFFFFPVQNTVIYHVT